MIVIRPYPFVADAVRVHVENEDVLEAEIALYEFTDGSNVSNSLDYEVVCTSQLQQAFNIELPKKFKRVELEVKVTRYEYE